MKDFLNQPHYRDLGQGNLQAMLKIAKRLKHPRLEDVEDELANRESAKHDKQAEKAERVAEKHAAPASESKHHEPVPKPKEKTEHELRSEATEASKKGDFNTRDKLDSMADKAKESKNLETGARGGRFYVNSAGKKVYVK